MTSNVLQLCLTILLSFHVFISDFFNSKLKQELDLNFYCFDMNNMIWKSLPLTRQKHWWGKKSIRGKYRNNFLSRKLLKLLIFLRESRKLHVLEDSFNTFDLYYILLLLFPQIISVTNEFHLNAQYSIKFSWKNIWRVSISPEIWYPAVALRSWTLSSVYILHSSCLILIEKYILHLSKISRFVPMIRGSSVWCVVGEKSVCLLLLTPVRWLCIFQGLENYHFSIELNRNIKTSAELCFHNVTLFLLLVLSNLRELGECNFVLRAPRRVSPCPLHGRGWCRRSSRSRGHLDNVRHQAGPLLRVPHKGLARPAAS